jgi:hypothetical protein
MDKQSVATMMPSNPSTFAKESAHLTAIDSTNSRIRTLEKPSLQQATQT